MFPTDQHSGTIPVSKIRLNKLAYIGRNSFIVIFICSFICSLKSEEEPHSHHKTPGRQTKQSNELSLLHQDDCKTRMDIK